MNSNSYFEIGNSHQICQDYALSGNFKEMHYGIVSDGCSTAEYSEIGSQILCHVAQYHVQLYYNLFLKDCDLKTIGALLANSIFRRADELRKLYPIAKSSLQATLLIAVAIGQKVWTFCWGDGYIIYNSKVSTWLVIDYPKTNAPFYLSTDRQSYATEFGEGSIVRQTCFTGTMENPHIKTEDFIFDVPYYSSEILDPGDTVTITTDGLGQYLDRDRKAITDLTIIPLVIDYPSVTGNFVERTMNFLKKDLIRKDWVHADDVGVATIVM
jgi:hypothetical protein